MKYNKAFSSAKFLTAIYPGITSASVLSGLGGVCVCVRGGGGEIKRLSSRTIFARVGALIQYCLSEHDGERLHAVRSVKTPISLQKYLILPHLNDPSCLNAFLRCLVYLIFVFLVIFLYYYFKF